MPAGVHPPQAPTVGRLRRLLGPFHVTGVFWYRFHRWGAVTLPRWTIGTLITLFTTFFFFSLWRIRRAIDHNLQVVLGPCGYLERQVRIYRTLWSFAWSLTERYEQLETDRRVSITISGSEHWEKILRGKQGFLFVTAHVGNWEAGSMFAAKKEARHVHVAT